MFVERAAGRRGACVRDRHRDAEHRVRAESAQVWRAVEPGERRIDRGLLRILTGQRLGDFAVDVTDGLQHAFAAVAAAVAVAKLERFAGACGRA